MNETKTMLLALFTSSLNFQNKSAYVINIQTTATTATTTATTANEMLMMD